MKLIINGEPRMVSSGLTAQQLVQDLGIAERKLALEVNQEIVPRSRFIEYEFQAGDKIEIIHAIGGG